MDEDIQFTLEKKQYKNQQSKETTEELEKLEKATVRANIEEPTQKQKSEVDEIEKKSSK